MISFGGLPRFLRSNLRCLVVFCTAVYTNAHAGAIKATRQQALANALNFLLIPPAPTLPSVRIVDR